MPGRSSGASLPRLVRGAVAVQRRRCGKPSCRCARGKLHKAAVLSYWDGESNRTLMLAPEDLAAARRAVERYRRARAALEKQAEAGIAQLGRTRSAGRARAPSARPASLCGSPAWSGVGTSPSIRRGTRGSRAPGTRAKPRRASSMPSPRYDACCGLSELRSSRARRHRTRKSARPCSTPLPTRRERSRECETPLIRS